MIKKLLIFNCLVLLSACKKDKIAVAEPPHAPTKWELISGNYKVYDTTGVFLYEMQLVHSKGFDQLGNEADSIKFVNFDGNFTFTKYQFQSSQYINNIAIGSYSALLDSVNNRWDIFGYGSNDSFNSFHNDSIIMWFSKHNTPYWWNDGTTYYHGIEKQIAVKQH